MSDVLGDVEKLGLKYQTFKTVENACGSNFRFK